MDQNTVLNQNKPFKSLKQVKTCIVSKNKFKRGKTAKNSLKLNFTQFQEVYKVLNAGAHVYAHTCTRMRTHSRGCTYVPTVAGAPAHTRILQQKKMKKNFFIQNVFCILRAHTRTHTHTHTRRRAHGRAGAGTHDPHYV